MSIINELRNWQVGFAIQPLCTYILYYKNNLIIIKIRSMLPNILNHTQGCKFLKEYFKRIGVDQILARIIITKIVFGKAIGKVIYNYV